MNTSVSRITRVVDMLDEAYAGPCSIARDPRPSRKVVSTLQVSRFMARQVHDGIPGNAAVGSDPRAGNPRSLPIWRAQVKSSGPSAPDRALSALIPGEQRGCVGLPRRDSGKHPLAASGALRHRPADVDLRAGLAAVDRERQRNQAIGPTRGTKDLQDEPDGPMSAHPSCVRWATHSSTATGQCSQRLSRTTVRECRFADRRRVARMGLSRPRACMSCLRCRLPGPADVP